MSFEVKNIFRGGFASSNVVLLKNLKNKTKNVLFDVSVDKYSKQVLEGIKNEGVNYDDISHIIISHTH